MSQTGVCTVEGCDRAAGGDLCSGHYERLRTTGTVGPAKFRRRFQPGSTLKEKLEGVGWEVDTATGCWIYQGRISQGQRRGYGRITLGGKEVQAHRAAFMVWSGPIPDGYVIMHTCDTRTCVNPAHLKLATQADNLRDRDAKRRGNNSRKTECKWGHPFDAKNTIWYRHETTGNMSRKCRTCYNLRSQGNHPTQLARAASDTP